MSVRLDRRIRIRQTRRYVTARRLEGKVAIITGAGSGIGRATAERFASEGAATVCADIVASSAEQTAEACRAVSDSLAVAVDVASPQSVDHMVAETLELFGAVDVLYANAGVAGVGRVGDVDIDAWDRVIAINLTGVFLCARAVVTPMIERGGGSIINQASIAALRGVAAIAPYTAAKGGVVALTRQMAVDYGGKGIRVNAICPGSVPTALVEQTYRERAALVEDFDLEEMQARMLARYSIGRLGDVSDIANLALFLASDESAWMTGGTFVADGGFTAT